MGNLGKFVMDEHSEQDGNGQHQDLDHDVSKGDVDSSTFSRSRQEVTSVDEHVDRKHSDSQTGGYERHGNTEDEVSI